MPSIHRAGVIIKGYFARKKSPQDPHGRGAKFAGVLLMQRSTSFPRRHGLILSGNKTTEHQIKEKSGLADSIT